MRQSGKPPDASYRENFEMAARAFLLLLVFINVFSTSVADPSEASRFRCQSDFRVGGSLPASNKWSMAEIKPKFLSSSLPWPESGSIQFALKKLVSAQTSADKRVVLQLGLKESNGADSYVVGQPVDVSPGILNAVNFTEGLFNCHIDRSDLNLCPLGATNPRCCYSNDYASVHAEMSLNYPACTSSCRSPCRAICSYDALIQIELGDLSNGSRVAASMVASRVSLTQKDGQFSEIDNDLGEDYFVAHSSQRIGNMSSQPVVGFWVNWIESGKTHGPILEMGLDGSEMAFFSHKFDQISFDRKSSDQHGWYGNDVMLPRASQVFKPSAWTINTIQGNAYQVFSDCKNVISSKSQPQPVLGGTCLNHLQCVQECQESECTLRRCLPEEKSSQEFYSCQIPPPPDFPMEIAIIFFLLALCLFLW